MKKVLAGVAAGALLLSVAGVVMAKKPAPPKPSSVNQFAITGSSTSAVSSSGSNYQTGKGAQTIVTGESSSSALSLTAGNVYVVDGKSGSVSQTAFTHSSTGAVSSSGSNIQVGTSRKSSSAEYISAGPSSSFAGSATVSNVVVSF